MAVAAENRVHLKREIGILHGVSIIIGTIIGSGIFVSPVGVLAQTKSVGMSFVMWLVTGLYSLVGSMVYAELGVTIPRSGGEYIYILKTFGDLPAFLCLWISFVFDGAASTAANSIIFAEYLLKPFFTHCNIPALPQNLLAILSVITLVAINSYNVKWAAKTSVVFTASKITATLIIIVIGFFYLAKGNKSSFENPFEGSSMELGRFAIAFFHGFWAFNGWNSLNFLTEEIKNPSRNLPMSIFISIIFVTVIYFLANVAYLAVLSPLEISTANAVAVTFADHSMGVMKWTMPIFVGFSIFGSMNGVILTMSRQAHTGAQEGHMPALLGMVSYKLFTPIPSVFVCFLFVFLFQIFSHLRGLIEIGGFAFCVIAAMSVLCLIHLRFKQPELHRPFKLPLWIPILFLAANLLIIALSIYQSPQQFLIGILLMFSGVPVYWFGISWKNKPKSFEKFIVSTTIFFQKLLQIVPQED